MKKILSIFLVACMLLSMSILAFAEAEDDGTNAELEAAGYKGISTEEELKSQTGKFYLKNDITITSGKGGNKTDTYIDGNGHTVTLAGGLTMVNWGKNVEMRNLTIDGEVILNDGDTNQAVFNDKPQGGSNDSSHYGPFSIHGIDEKLYVENCHSKVNITINVSDLPGSIGGFMGKSHGQNATWKNVSYTGTLNVGNGTMSNGSAEMRTIGGIAGMSGSNLTAVNVTVNATLNINATNASGVGGLFGVTRVGDNKFTNCTFNGELNFGGTCESAYGIGGIAGWAMGTPFVAEGLNNYGNISATNTENVGAVGGIFGHVNANKSHMTFDKVVNRGAITGTVSAGGVVGEFTSGAELADELPGFALTAVKNDGAVTAPYAAGGLIGKMNQLIPDFVVTFSNVVNTADISATAVASGTAGTDGYIAGAEGAGAVVGVMPAADEGGADYSFQVDTIYHIGVVSGENSTPLLKVPENWLLGDSGDAYYCQDVTGEHFGEKEDKDTIESIIKEINFVQVDKYLLTVALEALVGKLEADYTAETWAALATAIEAGTALNESDEATQEEVDAATAAINAAVEALTLKPLDRTALDALLAEVEALDKNDYRGDTWRNVTRALEDAKAELKKQSDVDKVLAALQTAVTGLVKKVDDTTITDALAETTAPEAQETTAAPTDAATTAAPEEKGCGGAIAATAVVLAAVLALGTGVALKKKED